MGLSSQGRVPFFCFLVSQGSHDCSCCSHAFSFHLCVDVGQGSEANPVNISVSGSPHSSSVSYFLPTSRKKKKNLIKRQGSNHFRFFQVQLQHGQFDQGVKELALTKQNTTNKLRTNINVHVNKHDQEQFLPIS